MTLEYSDVSLPPLTKEEALKPKGESKLRKGSLPQRWIDGTDPDEPLLQVHRYAEGIWIMRQSVRSHWEAPFLYLLAGAERAMLVDTGADGPLPLRETVDGLIGADMPLIVAHSHAHRDHVAGDGQFADRLDTVIVGHTPRQVAEFFGIWDWPTEIVAQDFGGRVIDVIPIPGHDPASITLYDRPTGLLLTNDSLYPGRLYIRDFAAFRASIERLVFFIADHQVTWILGCHVELTDERGVDFELAAPTHPHEHQLQLNLQHLFELRDALRAMGNQVRHEVHDHFIMVPR